MAMQPYVRETLGVYSSKPWGQDSQTYPGTAVSLLEILSDVESHKGDGKMPTAQSFKKVVDTNWQGRIDIQGLDVIDSFSSYISGVCDVGARSYKQNITFSDTPYNNCVQKLYEALRGKLDLAVDAVQARQSLSMVKKAVKGIAKMANTLRDIRRLLAQPYKLAGVTKSANYWRKRWRKIVKQASDKWLEFIYGWKPLADSIYGTLDRMLNNDVTFIKVKVKDTVKRRWENENAGSLYGLFPIDRTTQLEERCEIACSFKLSNSALESMAGYTSLNPASIVWESVPYSFVVDWVYNVGGYLRSLESAIIYGSAFQGGYQTNSYRLSTEFFCKGTKQVGLQLYTVGIGASGRTSWKQRLIMGGAPHPMSPSLEVNLGSGRLLNAAALAGQWLR